MVDATRLGLTSNPFEPAASGAPVTADLWLPESWRTRLRKSIDLLSGGRGVKALAVSGAYGSGKSYVLQWLLREEFPRRHDVKPFYFDNPGVQFYDLANSLLRQIGRKDLAKCIWELAAIHVTGYQRDLFLRGFEEYLRSHRRQTTDVLSELQTAIVNARITADEEIAHRLARLVTDSPRKPYFEYRDFVAGRPDALVAEREEAGYFGAILTILRLASGIKSVAFLVDEFEEISLQKRLTKREAHDYLATLRRLIDLTHEGDLWLVVAMTPDAVQKTNALAPALWDRFTNKGKYHWELPALSEGDATALVKHRLAAVRAQGEARRDELFPFPPDLVSLLKPATFSTPRRLVQFCFYAIGGATESTPVPFREDYLKKVEAKLYPSAREVAES